MILPPRHGKYNTFKTLCGAGGVTDIKGAYCNESAQIAFGMKNRVQGSYDIDIKEVPIIHEKVIYMNYYIHQWGHFRIDVINRLWYALGNRSYKIVYTVCDKSGDRMTGNYLELLKLLGIDEERLLCISEPTIFDEVIIPESSILPGQYYTKEYAGLFEKIIDNAVDSKCIKNKKLYCSRSNMKGKEIGEEKIEAIFNQNGYESVHLELLSLGEQIKLLNSAQSIAMINRSLAHNLLFVKERINICIINKTYKMNYHQFLINCIYGGNIVYVDSYVAPLPVLYGNGPFIIKISPQFEEYCKKFSINMAGQRADLNLSIREKIWFYIKWIGIYKMFILRRRKIYEDEEFYIDRKRIRQYYKKTQKMEEI